MGAERQARETMTTRRFAEFPDVTRHIVAEPLEWIPPPHPQDTVWPSVLPQSLHWSVATPEAASVLHDPGPRAIPGREATPTRPAAPGRGYPVTSLRLLPSPGGLHGGAE
ncbi:unnamed protein product [Rangifer tarandus platyrhynchus]|uniref:Uncharacterized protein n=1 Tax=Rangifer tarandus platyrhynchus TaxID=3082113 RepID=A0AC59YTT1_RANTA